MAKLLGTIPGFWYYNLQDTEMKGGTFTVTNNSSVVAFHDCFGDVARADPVVLDSAGVAITYLSADADHTVLIELADGTDVVTVTGVTGIPNPSLVAADLDVNGNSIVSASNADIVITQDGQGRLILDSFYWPTKDGNTGGLLSTDGSFGLSLSALTSFSLVLQTAPQLGGDLDTNSFMVKTNSAKGFHDDSDNEQLLFSKTTDAVNYLNSTNAATGNGCIVASAGDDTNIDMTLSPKGTGKVKVSGYSLPDSDGGASTWMETDGSGQLDFVSGTAAGIATGLPMATQAEMEIPVSTSVFVSPDNTLHHPGIATVWAQLPATTDASPPTVGYNCSSVDLDFVASPTSITCVITFSITMADANYAVVFTPGYRDTDTLGQTASVHARTTTSCTIKITPTGTNSTGYNGNIAIFGDLA